MADGGMVDGGMAAVVSGHYGSAATTGQRSLRVSDNKKGCLLIFSIKEMKHLS